MSSSSNDDMTRPHHSWQESFLAFFDRRVIKMLFLGFSAGLPLWLVFSTLSVWLREAEIDRSTITFLSWAGLGYGFKFVWAPIIDKMPLPVLQAMLGQRRSWLLVSQLAVIAALAFMAMTDPAAYLTQMAIGAVALGFSSATQDIVIDAYRIEVADPDLQGLMSASYIGGYRIGMAVAGGGALELAGWIDVVEGYDYSTWKIVYFTMAATMMIGVITTLVIAEPNRKSARSLHINSLKDYFQFFVMFILSVLAFVFVFYFSSDLAEDLKESLIDDGMNKSLARFLIESARFITATTAAGTTALILVRLNAIPREMVDESYIAPIRDFFSRFGRLAFTMILLIATYRIADVVMGVVANLFYVDLGFDKQEIGRITKIFGLGMTILGGFVGGLICMRWGVTKTLLIGGVLAAASNLLFAVMAGLGDNSLALTIVISADNLSGGIASAAFVAYLSSLTSTSFTAMQYALFSSMMLLFPKLIAGYSGGIVDEVGYATFFIGTAVIGIIPLILILYIARQNMLMTKAQPQG